MHCQRILPKFTRFPPQNASESMPHLRSLHPQALPYLSANLRLMTTIRPPLPQISRSPSLFTIPEVSSNDAFDTNLARIWLLNFPHPGISLSNLQRTPRFSRTLCTFRSNDHESAPMHQTYFQRLSLASSCIRYYTHAFLLENHLEACRIN